MKLLTLNSHSLLEEDYLKKTQIFVEEILQENIDVFALQEVNQSHDDKILAKNPHNYYGTSILKQNNHALYIADLLAKQGKNYHWIWEEKQCVPNTSTRPFAYYPPTARNKQSSYLHRSPDSSEVQRRQGHHPTSHHSRCQQKCK